MVVTRADERVISIPPTHSNIQTCKIHLPVISSLGILGVVAWGKVPALQKTGATRKIRGLLRFTLKHGSPFTNKFIFLMKQQKDET